MLPTLSFSKDRRESVFSWIFIWDCCQESFYFSLSEKTHRKTVDRIYQNVSECDITFTIIPKLLALRCQLGRYTRVGPGGPLTLISRRESIEREESFFVFETVPPRKTNTTPTAKIPWRRDAPEPVHFSIP